MAGTRADAFAAADPFPHLVIDDFLSPAAAEALWEEFARTAEGWDHYHHYNERKQALTHSAGMGLHTQQVVADLLTDRFVAFLERLTGIGDLVADPDLDGGGLHRVQRGGFLNIHADFLSHTNKPSWSRQLNLIVYLNKGWRAEWGGNLQFWDGDMARCVRSIEPVFNRCVIFQTSASSFHGHPEKLTCPPDQERRSLALYYFRDEGTALRLRPTHYRSTPRDSAARKILIGADRGLLRVYSFLKRYAGLSDGLANRILRRF